MLLPPDELRCAAGVLQTPTTDTRPAKQYWPYTYTTCRRLGGPVTKDHANNAAQQPRILTSKHLAKFEWGQRRRQMQRRRLNARFPTTISLHLRYGARYEHICYERLIGTRMSNHRLSNGDLSVTLPTPNHPIFYFALPVNQSINYF